MRRMRVPTQERPRRRFRVRAWIIGLVIGLLILLTSLRGLAGFYTDFLWFDEVGFGDTWRGLLVAKIAPAVVFTVTFFVVMLANLTIADRIAPRHRAMGPEDELVERYRRVVAPYAGRLRLGISLFFALIAGAGVSSRWEEWILFRNRVDFGVEDPQFGRDVGFYVFQLPFIRFVLEWAFVSLIVVLIVVAVFHYVNGGIRLQSPFQRVTPQVKVHLSVLLAVMALVKTAQYYFDRFELNFSSRGTIDGAGYTDVNAQLPALNLLLWISVAAAALFIANIWRRGWVLPVIAVGLWAFISVVVGTIYPEVIQRIQVQPNEFAREADFIDRNIVATRAAFGLDQVETREFDYQETLTADDLEANRETLENARLWDPDLIDASYQELQEFRSFYEFVDVDVDRYTIGDEQVPVLIATRELNGEQLPSSTWTNSHLVYTHGFGAVVSAANAVDRDSAPSFLVSDIPPEGELTIDEGALYFGENLGGYVIVNSKQGEIQPGRDASDTEVTYDGSGGVEASGFLRRSALALRFGDWNLLVSGQLNDDSRAIFLRDVRDRVAKAAPFLGFDADPYPVILDGKIVWLIDGYTTTSKYPYSQRLNPQGVPGSSGLAKDFNYVRNSVKAVVDAFDGSISFYVVDQEDPIIESWRRAFPELFSDLSELPDGLAEHFRYPQDLFMAQSEHFAVYHMTEPQVFYNKTNIWDVAPQPLSGASAANQTLSPQSTGSGSDGGRNETLQGTGRPIEPLYLSMELPDDEDGQAFVLMRPFVPRQKNNQLSAFMVAKSDPGSYGDLIVYETPTTREAPSPTKIATQIDSDPDISRQFTLLDQQGSSVIRGQLQLIPIENSIVYARPVYVRGTGESSFNRFKFLVVSYGEKSVLATDMEDGLAQIFEGAPPEVVLEGAESVSDALDEGDTASDGESSTTTEPPGTTPTTPPTTSSPTDELEGSVADLLRSADDAFSAADEALRDGDLVEWATLIEEGQALVEAARELAEAEEASATTTTAVAEA